MEKNIETKIEKNTIVFSTLKILEYWVRILQTSPDCVNRDAAIRLMDEKHTLAFVDEVVQYFKGFLNKTKKKKDSAPAIGELIVDDDDDEENFRTDVCCPRLLRAVNRYIDEAKPACVKKAATNFLKVLQNMDSDDMAPQLYQELQSITRTHFTNYAMRTLRKGISEKDPSFKRVQKIKKIYRLNNDELELLLFLWLRDSNDLEIVESETVEMVVFAILLKYLLHHKFFPHKYYLTLPSTPFHSFLFYIKNLFFNHISLKIIIK